ncbi:hypothetical protein [Flavobacterium sangjuense]|uniref:DUF3185 family protein n=1 Tax=Flavobacterium sangjuense TaxID=2518177 RepID=A0A4P7PSA3_9FLAO|nr:hypothetical protein [Flavobacterium sangjuense]QBZ97781.1 hypothetical protein GS03_01279 [Flavobacterium sangjuense]
MNTTKLIGAALIILSLSLAYIGINKIADNTAQIIFLGMKIDVSNESSKQQGYMYIGAAILLFAGGVYTLKSKS